MGRRSEPLPVRYLSPEWCHSDATVSPDDYFWLMRDGMSYGSMFVRRAKKKERRKTGATHVRLDPRKVTTA